MSQNIGKKILNVLFPRKEKVKENPGVIDHYDCKPYHNFRWALIYSGEKQLIGKEGENIEVFSRIYKDTVFVNVLVNKEEGFDISEYSIDKLKPLLEKNELTEYKNSIVFVLFQHTNEFTISQCKKFCTSDKNNFQQGCVFNPKNVQMDFYKPVPKFYNLYDKFCENIYFDLAFIDDTKR